MCTVMKKKRTYHFSIFDLNQDGRSDAISEVSYIANYKGSGRLGDDSAINYYRGPVHMKEMKKVDTNVGFLTRNFNFPPASDREISTGEVGNITESAFSLEEASKKLGTPLRKEEVYSIRYPKYWPVEPKFGGDKIINLFESADKILAKLPQRFSVKSFISEKSCGEKISVEGLEPLVKELVK